MPPAHEPVLARLHMPDEAATLAFAERLAVVLKPGDLVLLDGPVGAGKSVIARRVIGVLQAAAGQTPEQVPSPTFTIVQTYMAGDTEVWHCDLYRLGDAGEIAELGIDEAAETAIVLVEWPDRLPDALTAGALRLALATDRDDEDRRTLEITAGPDVRPDLARAVLAAGVPA